MTFATRQRACNVRHNLSQTIETDLGVTFECSTCGAVCEFVKPVAGYPNPVKNELGVWIPPADPEQWMGVCNG